MRRFARTTLLTLAVACVSVWQARAQDPARISVRVVGWNLQSDFTPGQRESDTDLLKQQIGQKNGVDIWGLSEVLNQQALTSFEQGAEEGESADFKSILGTTGNRDRLAIVYDGARFDLIATQELGMIQISSGLRAPLVAHFRGKTSGQEFLFMVNHLKRGGAQNDVRLQQARKLNDWVRTQTLPVIAVGDYNFDYDVERGDQGVPQRDAGFDAITKDGKFQWIRPERLVKTNSDDEFNSVLDFVFVANVPFGWFGESRILERGGDEAASANDFDDDDRETDHRPVDAIFTFVPNTEEIGSVRRAGLPPIRAGATAAQPSRAELLRMIRDLEQQLARLRRMAEQSR